MREIKFRALGVDANWRYGSHSPKQSDPYSINLASFFANLHVGALLPQTCCEFTGLKDKNGREIYEGDWISPAGLPPTDFSIKLVEFNSGWYGYKTIVGEWNILADTAHEGRMSVWEVIDNIYENPELLKETISGQ